MITDNPNTLETDDEQARATLAYLLSTRTVGAPLDSSATIAAQIDLPLHRNWTFATPGPIYSEEDLSEEITMPGANPMWAIATLAIAFGLAVLTIAVVFGIAPDVLVTSFTKTLTHLFGR